MDSPNNVEFSIKKKEDAKSFLSRFVILLLCFVPAFGMMIAFASGFTPGMMLMPLTLVGGILSFIYFKRFTKVEYEYVIMSGEFTVSAIYDNKSRKDLIKGIKVSAMHKVVPYRTNERLLDAPEIKHVIFYCSDLEHPDLYLAIYDDEKNGRTALVFNSSRKLMQIMKFYNSLNVTLKNDFLI